MKKDTGIKFTSNETNITIKFQRLQWSTQRVSEASVLVWVP